MGVPHRTQNFASGRFSAVQLPQITLAGLYPSRPSLEWRDPPGFLDTRNLKAGPVGDNPAMADIDVSCVTATDGWLCQVTVAEGGSETRHSVTLTRPDFQRLTTRGGTPDGLVRRSFEFMLEREPQESILKSFALPEIARYCPEYEQEISRRG